MNCPHCGAKRKTVQEIPPASTLEENLSDRPDLLVGTAGYEVCSWRDGPAGSSVPCTQVHVIVPVSIVPGLKVALRLKSARAVDELVGVLLEYRKEVFG